MTWMTQKPSKWTLACSCPCTKDAEGNRESHGPDCYRWEIFSAYWTRRGWQWKSCCSATSSAAEIGDTWSNTVPISWHCLQDCVTPGAQCFPRLLEPSPWLAGTFQPVPGFCGNGQAGSGHTPPAQVLPAKQRHRQRTLGGATSGGRSWGWVRRSTSQMLPRNVPWRDFGWGEGKVCGTTLWRYHHGHELMHSHPRARESLVRPRAAEPGLPFLSPRLCMACFSFCQWSISKLITCFSCLSRWSAQFMELSHCLTIFPNLRGWPKVGKVLLWGTTQCAEPLVP